jgi:hypothetical protein
MQNKKSLWNFLLVGALLLLFSSCSKEKEKPAAPTIEVVHLGIHEAEEDGIFYLGEEGHFEVNIKAPGRIKKIELEIDQESGYGIFSLSKVYEGDYVGKKEVPGFQDYPVIPEGEPIGAYSFHLKVTDQEGQVASLDEPITVKAGDGSGEHEHEH